MNGDGWRPRLVVSDLDGTFLSPDGTVSELNAAAVHEAVAAGIQVVFATGRPPSWLTPVAGLGLPSTLVIASNGAILHDVATGEDVVRHDIDATVMAAVVADVAREVPGTEFGAEIGRRFRCTPGYTTPRTEDTERLLRVPAAELTWAEPERDVLPVKLLVQHLGVEPDALAAAVTPVVGDRLTVTHSATGRWGLLELSGPGVSKASMLARWCAERGIQSAEVAAFGDMPNDRAMLEWVGHPHVMAEAHPSLSALPATRVGSCADSAVGRTLRGWL